MITIHHSGAENTVRTLDEECWPGGWAKLSKTAVFQLKRKEMGLRWQNWSWEHHESDSLF